MNKYEIMFIIKTTVDEKNVESSVSNLKSIITDMKGNITNFKEMGQRTFTYPINKEISGFYYVFNCEASAEAVAEFDRKARIDENVVRHLIIKLDEE